MPVRSQWVFAQEIIYATTGIQQQSPFLLIKNLPIGEYHRIAVDPLELFRSNRLIVGITNFNQRQQSPYIAELKLCVAPTFTFR